MFTNRPAMKKETPLQVQVNSKKPVELEKDFILIREAVQKILLTNASNDLTADMEQLSSKIEESFNQVLEEENILYNHAARTQMLAWVMAEMMPMEPEGWMILTRRLCLAFGGLALANELIWRTLSTDLWVKIETFGFPVALFAFLWFQIVALQKYMPDPDG